MSEIKAQIWEMKEGVPTKLRVGDTVYNIDSIEEEKTEHYKIEEEKPQRKQKIIRVPKGKGEKFSPGRVIGKERGVLIYNNLLNWMLEEERTRHEMLYKISRYYPNIKKNTVKTYLYTYKNYVKNNSIVSPIPKHMMLSADIGNNVRGKILDTIRHISIRSIVLSEYKEATNEGKKRLVIRKFYNIKSSVHNYTTAYDIYMKYENDEGVKPSELNLLRKKMVELWKNGNLITNKVLKSETGFSEKHLSKCISIMVRIGEVRTSKRPGYDLIFE